MDEQDKPELSMENWSDYLIDDLEANEDEKVWNRFVVMKQAEINTMMRILPQLRKNQNRIDSLCSAVNGACDPVGD